MKKTLITLLISVIVYSLTAMHHHGEESRRIILTVAQAHASVPAAPWDVNACLAVQTLCRDMLTQSQAVRASHNAVTNANNLNRIQQFITLARELRARMTAVDIYASRNIAQSISGLEETHSTLQQAINELLHDTTPNKSSHRALDFGE